MGSSDAFWTPEWRAWADSQLKQAGWTREDEQSVRYVVDRLMETAVAIQTDRDDFDRALDIFVALCRQQPLVDDLRTPTVISSEQQYQWFRTSDGVPINVGNYVRVRADAYTDPERTRLNGVEGTVIRITRGIALVRHTGTGESMHRLGLLERRVR